LTVCWRDPEPRWFESFELVKTPPFDTELTVIAHPKIVEIVEGRSVTMEESARRKGRRKGGETGEARVTNTVKNYTLRHAGIRQITHVFLSSVVHPRVAA
jgi:hypothetical protein